MTAAKPQIDCDTVSDGRRGHVRAGGGERGSEDGLNRRGEPLLASRFAAPSGTYLGGWRAVAGTPSLLLPGGGACCCPLGPRGPALSRACCGSVSLTLYFFDQAKNVTIVRHVSFAATNSRRQSAGLNGSAMQQQMYNVVGWQWSQRETRHLVQVCLARLAGYCSVWDGICGRAAAV